MSEDIFDIVDAQDCVVGSAPRSYVHANKLMHRASHVLMFKNCEGTDMILLQKRSATKDKYPLAYTTSCSGHVDSGEDYDTAVIREMFEETGLSITLSDLKKIGKVAPCSETENEFTFVYEMQCSGDEKFSPPADEVASLDWVSVADFEKMIRENQQDFTPSFLRIYNFWKNSKS